LSQIVRLGISDNIFFKRFLFIYFTQVKLQGFLLKTRFLRGHFFLLVATLVSFQSVYGQVDKNYKCTPIQDTIPATLHQALKLKLEYDKAQVTESKPKVGAYIKELYKERFDFIVENFNSDFFIVDTLFTSYLQSIIESIYKANPNLNNHASVYAYRSDVPNATSFGEGTIAFNLGLLAQIETEDQVAYILCHELAHFHLHHSNMQTAQYARLSYDKEIKKKVKAISKAEYGQFTKYSQLMNGLGLSINKHSREKEFEADSAGLLLFVNTKYDLRAPTQVMDILDSADENRNRSLIDFKKHFNFDSYPFKEQWLEYTKSDRWYASKEIADSMRTHPSCKVRKIALQRQIVDLNLSSSKNLSRSCANDLPTKSKFEIVESAYHFGDHGKSLFNTLLLAETYTDNVYLKAMVGRNLYQLYEHQKNHELSNALSLPDPRFDENYDRFLTFIHNLRLSELARITYHYATSSKEKYLHDEEFLYTLWLCSHFEFSEEKPETIKKEYLSRFPSGKYTQKLN
jgi:Zn-dependent protease with chaperone function